ncbi:MULTISPECIES: hypothetical protein [Mycobacterium]|uniref:hypothetical protein n=1 Tax=Mycobacterium TaxID=1763 RepID=UPI000A690FB4|nr:MULTISPECIES: hypothetical protein [Mycobacterium]MDP7732136.1 hypothetical protein [Mycobacterium sp. TY813]
MTADAANAGARDLLGGLYPFQRAIDGVARCLTRLTVIPAPPEPPSEDRIREIVREELARALPVNDVRDTPEGPLDEHGDAGADGEDPAPVWEVDISIANPIGRPHHTQGARVNGLTQRILKRVRNLRGHLDPVARVVHDVSHQTSPSHNGLDSLSVGDGPATGGDPAGPGHPKGGAQ